LRKPLGLLDWVWVVHHQNRLILQMSRQYRPTRNTPIAYDGPKDQDEEEAFDNFVKICSTLSKRHIARQLNTIRAVYTPLRIARNVINSSWPLAVRLDHIEKLRTK